MDTNLKFLVDAHLPVALCRILRAAGHDAVHTRELPVGNRTPDNDLRRLAMAEQRILITKDRDFYDSFLLRGEPSKLLLVKVGNLRKNELVRLFEGQLAAIIASYQENDLVELNRTEAGDDQS